jgi:hypothetical protein
MLRHLLRVLVICAIAVIVLAVAAFADDRPAGRAIQEEVWAIPVTLPTIAYVVRPVGDGPFPLVIMPAQRYDAMCQIRKSQPPLQLGGTREQDSV